MISKEVKDKRNIYIMHLLSITIKQLLSVQGLIRRKYFHPITSVAIFVTLILFCTSVNAQMVSKEKSGVTKISEKVSLEIYGGYLKGKSREIVYDAATGRMVSELFWDIDEAIVIGGALNVRPLDWLTLRLGGWTPVKSRNKMDDYDWLVTGMADWSDWSKHSDTKLNHAYMFDISAEARIASFNKTLFFDRADFNILAGFRWYNTSWTAFGGSAISSSNPGFRDQTATFTDGDPVISYEQWMETPYIGISSNMSKGRWLLKAELMGSLWGRMRDEDNHHLRSILFEEYFQNTAMVAGNISLSYALTKNIDLFGAFSYVKYFEAQGPTMLTDYANGTQTYLSGNAAGTEHQYLLYELGLRWRMF